MTVDGRADIPALGSHCVAAKHLRDARFMVVEQLIHRRVHGVVGTPQRTSRCAVLLEGGSKIA
jgi:hypothetical protein